MLQTTENHLHKNISNCLFSSPISLRLNPQIADPPTVAINCFGRVLLNRLLLTSINTPSETSLHLSAKSITLGPSKVFTE